MARIFAESREMPGAPVAGKRKAAQKNEATARFLPDQLPSGQMFQCFRLSA